MAACYRIPHSNETTPKKLITLPEQWMQLATDILAHFTYSLIYLLNISFSAGQSAKTLKIAK